MVFVPFGSLEWAHNPKVAGSRLRSNAATFGATAGRQILPPPYKRLEPVFAPFLFLGKARWATHPKKYLSKRLAWMCPPSASLPGSAPKRTKNALLQKAVKPSQPPQAMSSKPVTLPTATPASITFSMRTNNARPTIQIRFIAPP